MVNGTIGERLKTFRKSKRLIGEAFGELLNLGKAGVAHIEAGRQNLSIEQLKTLVQLFPELNVYWLLTGQGEMYLKDKQELEEEVIPPWEALKESEPRYEKLLKQYYELRRLVKNLNLDFSLNESVKV
ncbi:helix-turn-helix domain-containing protein [Adhaeribacter aquaticus]|uniref:helix-turn-helix domain-containing protein n=1 Tax=Adhaeribacter aquaticus TaxID=299567 RepID=UPI00040DAE41|nr:helix-turn-helix transcriptional regulator [Adhaeribacter aquaticus]